MKKIISITLLFLVLFSSCSKDDDTTSTNNLNSPDEYVTNPFVKSAISESGIPVYNGDNPPAIVGIYNTDGTIIDASSVFYDYIDAPINTVFEIYNQTTTGKINVTENVGGYSVSGFGGFITGDNGKFTIYGKSIQNGSDFDVPNLTLTVVFIMSGTQISNGNLVNIQGLTMIADVESDNSDYLDFRGNWYIWNADFNLQAGKPSGKNIGKTGYDKSMEALFQLIIEKGNTLN